MNTRVAVPRPDAEQPYGSLRDVVIRHRELIQQVAIVVILGALVFLFSATSPFFLTGRNILSIGREVASTVVVAFGLTVCIIAGEIDLSVGSVFTLAGMVAAGLMTAGVPWPIALVAAVLCGAAIGALNGLLAVKGRVSSLLVTLGTLTAIQGLTLILTNGYPISILDQGFISTLSDGSVFGIPNPILISTLFFGGTWLLLSRTVFGYHVYATGGNQVAARLAGVRTERVRLSVMVLCGALAAFAGVMLAARLQNALPTAGNNLNLNAISAVLLGGTSFMGGRGSAVLTVLGALVLTVIGNGFTLLDVPYAYTALIQGSIIVVAVTLDARLK
jgi:ribose transport system permease protein